MKKLNKDNKGFSLVELLVVIAIMVVLVGVIAPTLLNNIEKAREAKDIQFLDSVASAVQSTIAADEKAYEEIAELKAAVPLSDLYDESKFPSTKKVIETYLEKTAAATSSLSGTGVDKTSDVLMVNYNNGHIIVYLVDKDAKSVADTNADAKTAGALKGKRGTEYYVSR